MNPFYKTFVLIALCLTFFKAYAESNLKECCLDTENCCGYPDCYADYNVFPFYAAIEGGYMTFHTPRTVNGVFRVLTGPITPISQLISDHRAESCYTKLTVGTMLPCFSVEGYAFLFNDKKNDTFAGSFSSTTSFAFQPIDGSVTDLFGLPTPLMRGTLSNEFIYYGLGVRLEPNSFFDFCQFTLSTFLAFDFNKLKQNYVANFDAHSSTFIFAVTNSLDESVSTNYYDLGIGIDLKNAAWRCFFLASHAGIYASFASSKFHGNQLFTNRPIVEEFDAVRLFSVSENKNVFSHKFKGDLEVGYKFKCFIISVIGNIENWGYFPKILNPLFPEVFPAHIEKSHTFISSVGLKIRATY